MKKKLLTAVLSAVLCLGMGVTAFAANSPVGLPVWTGEKATATSYASDLAQYDSGKGKDTRAEIEAKRNDGTLSGYMESVAQSHIGNGRPYTYITGGSYTVTPGVETELPISGLAGKNVVVMHLLHNGTWEVLRPVRFTANGFTIIASSSSDWEILVEGDCPHYHWQEYTVAPTATTWGFTMHYCSDCGYERADNYIAPGSVASGTAAGGSVAATSPKTAESSLPMILLFAAVAAGGAAVYVKRRIHV